MRRVMPTQKFSTKNAAKELLFRYTTLNTSKTSCHWEKNKRTLFKEKTSQQGALKIFFLKTFANEFLLRGKTFKGLKNKVKVDGRKEKPLLQEKKHKALPSQHKTPPRMRRGGAL